MSNDNFPKLTSLLSNNFFNINYYHIQLFADDIFSKHFKAGKYLVWKYHGDEAFSILLKSFLDGYTGDRCLWNNIQEYIVIIHLLKNIFIKIKKILILFYTRSLVDDTESFFIFFDNHINLYNIDIIEKFYKLFGKSVNSAKGFTWTSIQIYKQNNIEVLDFEKTLNITWTNIIHENHAFEFFKNSDNNYESSVLTEIYLLNEIYNI